MKELYHGLSACMGDNPLAKACGLAPCIGGHTMVKLLLIYWYLFIFYIQMKAFCTVQC